MYSAIPISVYVAIPPRLIVSFHNGKFMVDSMELKAK